MSARRRSARVLAPLTILAAAAALGGCTQGHWSPTGDAMAGSNRRAEYLARADAPRAGTHAVVLSSDHYGRMANPAISDASNTTVTAGVETAE